jgi:[CysO sulfur-carrier protein]-S-L-cysteine hydrolase
MSRGVLGAAVALGACSLRSPMRISRQLLDEIVAHTREEAPNECCGMVSGTDGAASRVYRARNAFASPLRYEVHPQDQFRITTEIEDRGEEIAAIYHSHTKSEAYPSQTDVNLAANWPDPVYLICSLADPERPETRAFAIRDGAVEEVELVVE